MEALKNQYSRQYLEELAKSISRVHSLNSNLFIAEVMDRAWANLELMDRMRKIAQVIRTHLPDDFAQSAAIICKASENIPGGYLACYFPHFIAEYGRNDWDSAIQALEILTAHSTAEFAIRPFLEADFQRGMQQLKAWSKHPNQHVRRLSSEGARPFLPWGKQVPALKENLHLNLEILETLHSDDSEYVRKSVSNHLNDLSKINTELAFETGKRWLQKPNTHRTVKHGLRTLLKAAHPDSLRLFGYAALDHFELISFKADQPQIMLGDALNLVLVFKLREAAKLRIEYLVHYQKQNGSTSSKVFQWSEKTFQKSQHQLQKLQHFQDLSTRKHYPGTHRIEVRVNGEIVASLNMELMTF
jgi:3-methyladenine DNA glycosylase AlkC